MLHESGTYMDVVNIVSIFSGQTLFQPLSLSCTKYVKTGLTLQTKSKQRCSAKDGEHSQCKCSIGILPRLAYQSNQTGLGKRHVSPLLTFRNHCLRVSRDTFGVFERTQASYPSVSITWNEWNKPK